MARSQTFATCVVSALAAAAAVTAAVSWPTTSASAQSSPRSSAVLPSSQVPSSQVPASAGRSRELAAHVDFAIRRGVRYLYAQQNADGSFRTLGNYDDEAGPTALALLALAAAGEPLTRAEIRSAYAWLSKQQIDGTYSLSLRAAALSLLGDADKNPALRRDVQRLIAMQIDRGPDRGLYGYVMPKGDITSGDLSNSQYGVLGVWYAAEAGIEVPRGYWLRVEEAWTGAQCADGGFGYRPGDSGSYGSMTAAGIATLAITHDFLHASTAGGPQGKAAAKQSRSAAAATRALAWLDRYFLVDRNPGRDTPLRPRPGAEGEAPNPVRQRALAQFGQGSYIHYMLFGYERVGEATGLTRFAAKRWFDEGARFLVSTQAGNGSWDNGTFGETIDTSYALLFLSRGRSPVVVQKLQWTPQSAKPANGNPSTDTADRWNNRTRDAASMVRWLRRQTERHVNWQIARLDDPITDLREAPILYAASDQPFTIPEAQWATLKRYLDEGGLLLAADESTTKGGGPFSRSVEDLLSKLYPRLVPRELPKDHPFLTSNFRGEALDVPVRVLSNGVREIAVILPEGDFPWRWQRSLGTVGQRSPDFALVGNVLVNITGRANLRFKGTYHLEDPDPARPAPEARYDIARIQYGGNWDPEPLAWPALSARLHNAGVATLTTSPVALTDASLRADRHPLAHLTATHAVSLSPRETRRLADYLRTGGTLLFDVAGGTDVDAALAGEQLLRDAISELTFRRLPADHPIYSGVLDAAGNIAYRPAAADRVGGRVAPPRLRGAFLGDRLVAVLSGEDLTAGLLGIPHDTIVGYTPDASRALVANLCALTLRR